MRKDKGLSQKELGEIFHVSSSAISSYETGVHIPDANQIVQFADFFEVTTDYILGRSSCDISPSVLTKPFIENTLVQDILMMMDALPDEHKRAIVLLVDEINFGVTMREQAKRPSKRG